jgi:hypothetical protein
MHGTSRRKSTDKWGWLMRERGRQTSGPDPKGDLKLEFIQICPEFERVQMMPFQT